MNKQAPRKIALNVTVALTAAALVLAGASTAEAAVLPPHGVNPTEQIGEPVDVVTEGSGPVVTSVLTGAEVSEVAFELPGDVSGEFVDPTSVPAELLSGGGPAVSTTEVDGSVITSYPSDLGVQTLIEIPDRSSPTEYSFAFDLSNDLGLALQPDGSVFISDESGVPVAMLDVPWAVDANGDPVPTSFRVEDHSVVQVVDTSAVTAYPVIADPDLWFIVTNSAGCLAEIAGLSLVGAKAVQVFAKADKIVRAATALGKYYDALGGTISKVLGVFKKWINNRVSLTRAQLSALEGLIREGAKILFNAVGLGSCYALVRGS